MKLAFWQNPNNLVALTYSHRCPRLVSVHRLQSSVSSICWIITHPISCFACISNGMKFCFRLQGSGNRLPDMKQYSSLNFNLCLLSSLLCSFEHTHRDALSLSPYQIIQTSRHQYFVDIKKTIWIWICVHLITFLSFHCLSHPSSGNMQFIHAYVIREQNKMVLINSLSRPRVLF